MHGRGLLIFFGLTLLLPGAALVILGARALMQERVLVEQQVQQRLADAADGLLREFDREVEAWSAALDRPVDGAPDAALLPASLRMAATQPATVAFLTRRSGHLTVWPAGRLLYDVMPELPSPPPPAAALQDAERAELAGDYATAIARYRAQLTAAGAAERALVIHRLARTYRKAGRAADALALFETLAREDGSVGVLPAALIGRYEVCAMRAAAQDRPRLAGCAIDLYEQLVRGSWRLSRERYSFYASSARDWVAIAGAPLDAVAAVEALEAAKRELTEAAQAAADFRCDGSGSDRLLTRWAAHAIVAWRCPTATLPASTIVVSRRWIETDLWPRLTAASASGGLQSALLERDDLVLHGSDGSASAGVPSLTREGSGALTGLRVRVWPRDAGALTASFAARQRLYVLILTLVMALLAFGAYATHRVVRRELQFAQLKSEFVSTVSHEFRSPLTAIRQLGEMLMRNRVPEARRPEYYERITRESERLARLVDNLLDFAQMEGGRKRYRLEPIETAGWLRRTVGEFQLMRDGGQARVQADIPEVLSPVRADAEALSVAIHNLLDNAVKYSPGQDTVWLDAEQTAGHVVIRVRDAGVGISARDKQQIFEKFFRATADITREVKGAGLGLSLVRHIVAAHDGRIECESEPGRGTTFTVYLRADMAGA